MKQFFVKGVDDKTCTFNYNSETYFEQIYLELEKRYCISRNYFWLRYHKQINPNILVSSIISAGATVFMVCRANSDVIEDIIIVQGKQFSYPRDMLMESGVLRQYYLNLIPNIKNNRKTIYLNNFLSKSDIRLLGNSKELVYSFDHFYNIFVLLYSKERHAFPQPISSNTGLKEIVPVHILNYMHKIKVEDLKNMVIFSNILKLNYFKDLFLSYLAHYIYRKKNTQFIINNSLI